MIGNQKENKLAIANLYRPHGGSRTDFIDELSEFLSFYDASIGHRLLVCGDVNYPESSGIGEELLCLLDEHGLTQYVSEPTRENNILDIIATREEDSLVGLPDKVTNLGVPFDHNLVSCQLHVGLERQSRVVHTYRDFKSIDVSRFRQMLSTSTLFSALEASPSAYANQIESVTTTIINNNNNNNKLLMPCV